MQANPVGVYRGIVTSTNDPSGRKRIRTQVPQLSGAAEIRWAEPVNVGEPVPKVNTVVWVAFHAGDINKPIYFNNSTYANGGDPVGWTTIALSTGYTHNGSSLGNVQARKVVSFGTTWVEWRGGMDVASTGTSGSFAVPNGGVFAHIADSSYYPGTKRTVTAAQNFSGAVSSVKLEFNTNGDNLVVSSTTLSTLWVSFNNIRYPL